jgi:hypothetical protein
VTSKKRRLAILGAAFVATYALLALIVHTRQPKPATSASDPSPALTVHTYPPGQFKTAMAVGGPEPSVGLYWVVSGDPTTGSGICAPQWQLLFRTDNNTLYYKKGTACTAWTPFEGAGGGTVSSITCSTGLTCTPNPITTTGTEAIANTTVTPGSYTYASVTFNAQGQATAASSGTAPGTIASTADVLKGDGAGNAIAYGGSSPSSCSAGNVTTGLALSAAGVLTNSCTAIGTAGGVTGTGTSPDLTTWTGSTSVGNYGGSSPSACGAGTIMTAAAFSASGTLSYTCTAIGTAGGITGTGTSGQVAVFDSTTDIKSFLAVTAGSAGLTIESTNGSATSQSALFSTTQATSTDGFNVCIGGGGACQSSTYDGTNSYSASRNTALGYGALGSNTTGYNNTAIGDNTLTLNTTGFNNTAIGQGPLQSNIDGTGNTAIGGGSATHGALAANTHGQDNTAVGVDCMTFNTTGSNNTAIGNQAMEFNQSGNSNVAVGLGALDKNVSNGADVAVGESACLNCTADDLVAIGALSLGSNTTGAANTSVGYNSMAANVTGADNVCVGYNSMTSSTSSNGTAMGFESAFHQTSAGSTTAIGYEALFTNVSGAQNTAVGASALGSTTAGENTALGVTTLYDVSSGGSNTGVGWNTGRGITTGSYNTIVGANVTGLSTGLASNVILADGSGNIRYQDNAGASSIKGTLNVIGNLSVATANVWKVVAATGHVISIAGGTPVLSSCGTGSPTVTGTDHSGYFTTGGTATACTLTFATTYTNRPACIVEAEGTATEPTFTVSATAITITVDIASTTYDYWCQGAPTST